MERLWPWFWNHVGEQLGDPARAGDLAEEVAYRVASYLQTHDVERSLGGLCRVAARHFIETTRAQERKIEFHGLSQEIETSPGVLAPEWQTDLEFWIWVDQVLQGHPSEIRTILQLRLLRKTWDQVGEALGMSGGQARLRFRRALKSIRTNRKIPRPDRGST
jgi:DNA-directed RNA polymerase specialized sigma24 family protein